MRSSVFPKAYPWPTAALTWPAVIWCLVCLACFVRVYLQPTKQTVFHDYGAAGRAWVNGADAYNLDRADGRIIPSMSGFRYAPLVSVLLVPFSVVPNEYGGVLWRLAGIACFLGAYYWFLRDVLPGGDDRSVGETVFLWLALMPLSLASLNNGQANVLLMGLIVGAGAAAAIERWNLAAGLLAGACLLKIYPVAIALLLLLIYPRQLTWRFVLAVAIGLALPFAFQSPSYVLYQYDNWLTLVASDNRGEFPLAQGYRDFHLLTRYAGVPLSPFAYKLVQLAAAALVASVVLLGRWRGWPTHQQVTTALTLGCAWTVVFGPSVESCTYIQIAPALAWALAAALKPGYPAWSRYTLFLICVLFLAAYCTAWFRASRDWFYLAQPIAAVLFLVERLAWSVRSLAPTNLVTHDPMSKSNA